MHLLSQDIWGHIWKHTVVKRVSNAISVIMHPMQQAIWGNIWKCTVEKSQTNATSVTLHPLGQAIWGLIWKHTVEKSKTNATNNVNLQISLYTKKHSISKISFWIQLVLSYTLLFLLLWKNFPRHQHINYCQPCLCLFCHKFPVLSFNAVFCKEMSWKQARKLQATLV